jgi:hypothetical protein
MCDDAAEHDQSGDHQHVAAGALGADESRETDGPGRARNVLDRRQAGDPLALQRLLHHARGLIPAAAGCGWCDQAQLLDRLRVRRGDESDRPEQDGARARGEGARRHRVTWKGRVTVRGSGPLSTVSKLSTSKARPI